MMERPDIASHILKEGIATAHDQVIYLSKMVNDLSTLSRAERGVADTAESIHVRELVNDLFNEYAPQADKKNLHFDLDLATHLGYVNASRLYLKELLQNFITNAIKYTKEGSVTLHVERKDDKLIFSVKDTGIGISKTDQAKVFNKFYRSEDYRTRETGGTGLGLYVAVKLAKKLGTKIELTSRLNHGSTFSFALPASDNKQ
jgi:signal transduction histidine kinase